MWCKVALRNSGLFSKLVPNFETKFETGSKLRNWIETSKLNRNFETGSKMLSRCPSASRKIPTRKKIKRTLVKILLTFPLRIPIPTLFLSSSSRKSKVIASRKIPTRKKSKRTLVNVLLTLTPPNSHSHLVS
jgi:hypothetical protein